MRTYLKHSFYICLFLIINSLPNYSATITITSPEDAYIEGSTILGSNNNTHGSSAFLTAYTNSHLWSDTLIKFPSLFGNNPNQIPLNATISSAELHLWLDYSWEGSNNTFSLYQLTNDWNESSVTSNSYGAITPNVNALALPVDTKQGPLTLWNTDTKFIFDVKDSIINWSTSGNNFGWGLISNGPNNQFFSSENTNVQKQPTLVINYSTVPEPATILFFVLSILGITSLRKKN